MDPSFLGAWQVDQSQTTGLDEWGKAMGLSPEKIQLYKNLDYEVSITQDGDQYTVSIDFKGKAPNKTFVVKLGEEIDYTSMDGYTCKLTLTFEGGKTVESYVYAEANKKWQVVRSVDGDVMTAVASMGDTSTTSTLKRV